MQAAHNNKTGRETISGFYDGVKDLPSDIKAELKRLKLTPKEFLGGVGLKVPAGEKNRMLIEQIATRPTAEINGMIGGFNGERGQNVGPGPGPPKKFLFPRRAPEHRKTNRAVLEIHRPR